MTALEWADAGLVVGKIRAYHQPQDVGDATINAWHEALTAAGVTSGGDAVQAVINHYSTPGAERWVSPADIVAEVRAIRAERLLHITDAELTADIDPSASGEDYVRILRARKRLIADGLSIPQAITQIPVPREIEAHRG